MVKAFRWTEAPTELPHEQALPGRSQATPLNGHVDRPFLEITRYWLWGKREQNYIQ